MSSPATAPRALIVSEAAFLKQTDNIQKCFDTFKGIVAVPNIGYAMIKPIVANLIDATVCFSQKHIPFLYPANFALLFYRTGSTVSTLSFTILFSRNFLVKFKTP